jgi:hypothetical protein
MQKLCGDYRALKCYVATLMPWDCDKYFEFDRKRDAELWPISPARHAPVAALAFALCCGILALVLI